MGLVDRIISKFYFKQWTIGVAEQTIEDVIRTKKLDVNFKWYNPGNHEQSFADPFVTVDTKNGDAVIFVEQFNTGQYNGIISCINYSKNKGFSQPHAIINNNSHLSYPLVVKDKGRQYIIAENAYNATVTAYEYNPETKQVVDKVKITSLPLVDATFLQKDGKYWLFATMLGKGVQNELHIFYADELLGPYQPHKLNPVKQNFDGARPAGNFIQVDGEIYRPAQNCADYYGKSMCIQKLKKLNKDEFEEEEYMQLSAENFEEYNLGIHTINSTGKYLVVDAQKGHFQPVRQLLRFFKRIFFNNKKKLGIFSWLANIINAEICNIETAGFFVTGNYIFI